MNQTLPVKRNQKNEARIRWTSDVSASAIKAMLDAVELKLIPFFVLKESTGHQPRRH